MKFKVGDRVRVIKTQFGANDTKIGDIGTIRFIKDNGSMLRIAVEFDKSRAMYHNCNGRTINNKGYWCAQEMLELVTNECIVIYRKNDETVALNKSTGEKAIAKCSPEDEFDFITGARIAFDRLVNPKVKEVHRKAKAGEYVKIINAHDVPKYDAGRACYKNGDIIMIINNDDIFRRARFKEGKGINGREYVLCDNEYVVLEGYKPEIDDKIKIGDRVKVVNDYLTYTGYVDWVERHVRNGRDLRYKLDYGHRPDISHTYRVRCIAKHLDCDKNLAYIQDLNIDRCYVIGIEGLEKC